MLGPPARAAQVLSGACNIIPRNPAAFLAFPPSAADSVQHRSNTDGPLCSLSVRTPFRPGSWRGQYGLSLPRSRASAAADRNLMTSSLGLSQSHAWLVA